ncbi:kinase-like domain-containing protein [Podospora appendiculata]|uniref:Kinase-like domain-containing protein n=1 Tax=Podospora appendiculata TaxID=314037 RepID=A0AAE1C8D4_9PEZI|nr:kinase-like domain-containing protein [Podospora appendiculata]
MSSMAVAQVEFEDRSCHPPTRGTFFIFPNQTIKIGRDEDVSKNDVAFRNPAISRGHLEFHSIMVDEEDRHCPLVFVRDRQSFNGTYVNDRLIGKAPNISPARLLQDGDNISIQPHLTFKFTQHFKPEPVFRLNAHQRRELLLIEDKYVVTDRTIGDGAHALVYLATDVRTGQQVVCKVHNLNMRLQSYHQEVQRVRQEAILLSYLDHPNVLSIKSAFQSQGNMYIFTELATGGDLFSLLARYKVFTEVEIRWIIRQVVRGVAYIHSKGVAHRDIKPENVLCAVAPKAAFRLVLSDFGDSAMTSRGRMKSYVGTSFYRAPECHTPEAVHGLSVDIWAVGMLTLQLFSGLQELTGVHNLDLSSQAKVDDYLDAIFDEIGPSGQISREGKHFIRGCLLYDSDARFTAPEALRHRWLRSPKDHRNLFTQLENENASSWSPRGIMLPVIEDLADSSSDPTNRKNEDLRAAAPDHDHAVSPYFTAVRAPALVAAVRQDRDRPGEADVDSVSRSSERNLSTSMAGPPQVKDPISKKRKAVMYEEGSQKRKKL